MSSIFFKRMQRPSPQMDELNYLVLVLSNPTNFPTMTSGQVVTKWSL